ncbi:MAG: Lrp/AsnC family transcriptional regulator [Nanoarchaeota archaeon]
MLKLNKKDHHVLFELDRDSRQSISKLAKKTRLSRDVVGYRIKQLEKSGIIQKYITIVDFTKFFTYITRLYLKLQNTTPEIEQQMVDYFIQQKNNLTVFKTDGHYDLAVGFLVKDLHQYQLMWEQFLIRFKNYIQEKNFSIFLDFIHYPRNYLVESKLRDFSSLSTGSFSPFSLDEKDVQLLKLIKEDARISLLDLAKKLNMTATGVKYKLKNLEKNKVIVAYKLLIDSSKLGYTYYKIDLTLEDMNIIPSLHQYILQHPNILYRDVAVGGSDFEFDGEFPSQEAFYQFMDELKAQFPKKIRRYWYYKALKIYRFSYFPEEI